MTSVTISTPTFRTSKTVSPSHSFKSDLLAYVVTDNHRTVKKYLSTYRVKKNILTEALDLVTYKDARSSSILSSLLENKAQLSDSFESGFCKLMMKYTLTNDITSDLYIKPIYLYIKHTNCINKIYDYGGSKTTILNECICAGSEKAVKLLLLNKADVNLVPPDTETPIMLSVLDGNNLNIVKALVESKSNVNVESGISPIYVAAMSNNKDLYELLRQYGADVDYKYDGSSAKMWMDYHSKVSCSE